MAAPPYLLWQNKTTGAVIVWYMDGATLVDAKYLYAGGLPDWKVVGGAGVSVPGHSTLLTATGLSANKPAPQLIGTPLLEGPRRMNSSGGSGTG